MAIASPIPDEAPVTSTFFPRSFAILVFLSRHSLSTYHALNREACGDKSRKFIAGARIMNSTRPSGLVEIGENWSMKRKPFNSDLSSETSDFEDAKPGAGSAGQSGDTQGLSDDENADSESVRELVEEG